MLESIPFWAWLELRYEQRAQKDLRNGPALLALARRHRERRLGRLILLSFSFLIGLSALRSPFMAPQGITGWLVTLGLLFIPALVQVDGLRDLQLRRYLRSLSGPTRMGGL
jgi:hypothetical protein